MPRTFRHSDHTPQAGLRCASFLGSRRRRAAHLSPNRLWRFEQLEPRQLLDATMWYVDDVTDPQENGTELHPFDTIQEAIDRAATDDHVVLLPGTYTGDGNRDLDTLGKAITVRSTEPTNPAVVEATTIDAQGTSSNWHRAFYVHRFETGSTVISGLTITGGYENYGGGVYLDKTAPTIAHCRFVGNEAQYDGGAVYINVASGTVGIHDNTFRANAAGRDGGALFGWQSTLISLASNAMSENSAARHGGSLRAASSSVALVDNEITDNTAGNDAGGVYIDHAATVTMTDNRINDNTAVDLAGGLGIWNSTADLQTNQILRNQARHGGGIYAGTCTMEVTNGNVISDNIASWDVGGLYLVDIDGNVIGNTIHGNTAGHNVGGLHINGSYRFDGHVSNNTVTDNSSGGRGGGMDLYNGTFAITGNTVTGNTAITHGGGFFISGSTVDVQDNVISNNTASADQSYGGGIRLEHVSGTIGGHNTITNNSGGYGGGISVWDVADGLTITDNEIANNTSSTSAGGIGLWGPGFVTVASNTVADNTATNDGGGIYTADLSKVTLRDNRLLRNTSTNGSAGGAMLWNIGTSTLNINTLEGNTCKYDGGAVYAYNTALTSDHDTLSANEGRWGAGLYARASDVTFTDGTVEGNIGESSAAGIHFTAGSTGTIRGNTIRENHATGPGGGISLYDSEATIQDNVIEGNTASWGAGIAIRSHSHAKVIGNRILGNVAETGDGGGVRVDQSLAYLDGNLIADNVTKNGYGGGLDCYLASPLVRWNVFQNNYAPNPGTQVASYGGSPWLINNTLFTDDPSVPPDLAQVNPRWRSMPLILNTVIWGPGPSIENPDSSHLFFTDTSDDLIFPEDGNLASDPRFVDVTNPLGPDGLFGTGDDGFHLLPDSPCIDTGHEAFLDADGTRSDMGAFGDARATVNLAEIHVDWTNLAGPWNGSSDHPYRRIWEALLAAGDDDTVHVGIGYYEENLIFRSDKANLTVSGTGADTSIINGTRRGQAAGVTEVWFAEGLEITGLNLQNGQAGHGGAMRVANSTLDLHDNTLQDCDAAWDGGALYLESNSQVTVDHNRLLRNTANYGGGLRMAESCSATITDNLVADNSLHNWYGDGAGLWIDGNPIISGNTIADNKAGNRSSNTGGGIYCHIGSQPMIDHNLLVDNQAFYGGGLYASRSNATLINNTFARNKATNGGGIGAGRSTLEIVNTILWDNTADNAAELDVRDRSNVAIRYSDIQDGRAEVAVADNATLDWGLGMIYADPLFAPHTSDFHLKSTTGRWDPSASGATGAWVTDDMCSPAIDRGEFPEWFADVNGDGAVNGLDVNPFVDILLASSYNAAADMNGDGAVNGLDVNSFVAAVAAGSMVPMIGDEPQPNGNRINMGAYGGTVEASMSCQLPGLPPTIVQMDPAPASTQAACVDQVQVWFSTDMLPTTVEDAENWRLVGSGGDGAFFDQGQGDDNDVVWPVLGITYPGTDAPAELLVSDLPCGCLPRDVYRLTARDGLQSLSFIALDGDFPPGGTADDLPSGNGQAGGDFVATFEITDAPPAGIPGHATVVQDSQDNELILHACDADSDALTFEICWAGDEGRTEHGTLLPGDDQDSSTWYYTPDPTYSGSDTFQFRAFDGQLFSECTDFTIDVVPEPCDLAPTQFAIVDEGDCFCPGKEITVSWEVINNGPAATVDLPLFDWYDRVYFSADDVLDPGDRLLGSSPVMRDQPLAAGEHYNTEAIISLPSDLAVDGGYHLILKTDDRDMQAETDEENNVRVIDLCIRPFVHLTGPFCGIFVDPDDTLALAWDDVAESASAYVNIALDTDTDPTNGYTPLLESQSEDPDGEADQALVDVPDLLPGVYHLYAWLTDGEGNSLSCPSEDRLVYMFEQAYRINDPVGDTVAGFDDGYEIYSVEIGITGDRMEFRVRTDFDPRSRGGDVFIQVDDVLSAIAVASRQLADGREVIGGDLYSDVSFLPGKVEPWAYRIVDWQGHVSGHSGVEVVDDVACLGAEFALMGWLDLPFLIGFPGGSNGIGWTMWCGNDWAEVHIPPLPGDVNYDGNVNGLDVNPFVEVLLSGSFDPTADMIDDGLVNGLDVAPFVEAVLGAGISSAAAAQSDIPDRSFAAFWEATPTSLTAAPKVASPSNVRGDILREPVSAPDMPAAFFSPRATLPMVQHAQRADRSPRGRFGGRLYDRANDGGPLDRRAVERFFGRRAGFHADAGRVDRPWSADAITRKPHHDTAATPAIPWWIAADRALQESTDWID